MVLLLIFRYIRRICIEEQLSNQLWVVDVVTGLSNDETSFHLRGNDQSEPLENKSDWITRNKSIAFSNINEFSFCYVQTFITVFRSSSCAELNEEKMVRNIR